MPGRDDLVVSRALVGGLQKSGSWRNLLVDFKLALGIGSRVAELHHAVLAGLDQIYSNPGLGLSPLSTLTHAVHRQERQQEIANRAASAFIAAQLLCRLRPPFGCTFRSRRSPRPVLFEATAWSSRSRRRRVCRRDIQTGDRAGFRRSRLCVRPDAASARPDRAAECPWRG